LSPSHGCVVQPLDKNAVLGDEILLWQKFTLWTQFWFFFQIER